MQRVLLLGVPLDVVTREEAVRKLQQFLHEPQSRHVVTPNSEMLVEATRNPVFRDVLQRSALNLPDGIGLLWMARITGQKIPERVTGVDTVWELCSRLYESTPVFLLGGRNGVARCSLLVLREGNPRLNIVGVYEGSPDPQEAPAIIQRINAVQPHLLLVAFGAPAQDLWIDRYLHQMPSVRVAMGIGGTLDFLAGAQRRAPWLFQRLGVEWLWRLVRQPWRFRRIWKAVVVFPWLVVKSCLFP